MTNPMSYGSGYGNWQQYAGFNNTTNPFGGSQGIGVQPSNPSTSQNGVAPPSSFSELADRFTNNLTQKANNFSNNISSAVNQASQGNALNAINSLRGIGPANGAQQTVDPGATQNFLSQVGNPEGMEQAD
jgi:hypothetical protein